MAQQMDGFILKSIIDKTMEPYTHLTSQRMERLFSMPTYTRTEETGSILITEYENSRNELLVHNR